VYRLKDAGMLSAQQRFVGWVRVTRAETFKLNSDEFNALELYVASRGNGLSVEGVAVRH
jgi:sulfur-oxidizing protein SoxA